MSTVRCSELTVSHGVREPAFLLPAPPGGVPAVVIAAGVVAAGAAVAAAAWALLGPVAGAAIALAALLYVAPKLYAGESHLALTPARVVVRRPFSASAVEWEAVDGAPVAGHPAVAIYRREPERRAAIGTPAERDRLEAELTAR